MTSTLEQYLDAPESNFRSRSHKFDISTIQDGLSHIDDLSTAVDDPKKSDDVTSSSAPTQKRNKQSKTSKHPAAQSAVRNVYIEDISEHVTKEKKQSTSFTSIQVKKPHSGALERAVNRKKTNKTKLKRNLDIDHQNRILVSEAILKACQSLDVKGGDNNEENASDDVVDASSRKKRNKHLSKLRKRASTIFANVSNEEEGGEETNRRSDRRTFRKSLASTLFTTVSNDDDEEEANHPPDRRRFRKSLKGKRLLKSIFRPKEEVSLERHVFAKSSHIGVVEELRMAAKRCSILYGETDMENGKIMGSNDGKADKAKQSQYTEAKKRAKSISPQRGIDDSYRSMSSRGRVKERAGRAKLYGAGSQSRSPARRKMSPSGASPRKPVKIQSVPPVIGDMSISSNQTRSLVGNLKTPVRVSSLPPALGLFKENNLQLAIDLFNESSLPPVDDTFKDELAGSCDLNKSQALAHAIRKRASRSLSPKQTTGTIKRISFQNVPEDDDNEKRPLRHRLKQRKSRSLSPRQCSFTNARAQGEAATYNKELDKYSPQESSKTKSADGKERKCRSPRRHASIRN